MSDVLATKPLPEYASLYALSPAQARAAITLAHGGTVTAASDAAAVHRSTIYNWYENDSTFQCAIKEIFDERNRRLLDQMRELDTLALVRLHRILADDAISPSVHLRAAMAVLNRPVDHHGEEAWQMPHMESLDATIHCRPDVLDTPEFDTHRHIAAPPQPQPLQLDTPRQNSTDSGELHPHPESEPPVTSVLRHSSTELDTENAFPMPQAFDTARHNSTQSVKTQQRSEPTEATAPARTASAGPIPSDELYMSSLPGAFAAGKHAITIGCG